MARDMKRFVLGKEQAYDGKTARRKRADSSSTSTGSRSGDVAGDADFYKSVVVAERAKRRRTTVTPSSSQSAKSVAATSAFYCETCKITVADQTLAQHVRSLAHQVDIEPTGSGLLGQPQPPPQQPVHKKPFGIGPSNVGYRMLRDQGWSGYEGLGPRNDGRLEPIATALKNDRAGLGAPNAKPLVVTHTQDELERHHMTVKKPSSDPTVRKRGPRVTVAVSSSGAQAFATGRSPKQSGSTFVSIPAHVAAAKDKEWRRRWMSYLSTD